MFKLIHLLIFNITNLNLLIIKKCLWNKDLSEIHNLSILGLGGLFVCFTEFLFSSTSVLTLIFSDCSSLLCTKPTRWQWNCWYSTALPSHQGKSPGFRSIHGWKMWDDYCPPNQQTLLGESSQGWGSTTVPTEPRIAPRPQDLWDTADLQGLSHPSTVTWHLTGMCMPTPFHHTFLSILPLLKLLFWTKD